MKKNLSILLALILLVTTIPASVFAEKSQDQALKEAIVKSKELFDIGDEYDNFNQSISLVDETTIFNLNWSDSKEKLGDINVTITMDGLVLSYNKWQPVYGKQETSLPSISKEEGLKIAEDFIEKVAPSFAEKIKYRDKSEALDIGSDSYSYNFVRMENDIAYYNNNVNVEVNNSTGKISNYNANWDINLKFQDTKDLVSLEQAKNLYKEKIGLDLIYKTGYENRDPKSFLIYGPLNKDLGINAKNGEVGLIQREYLMYEGLGGMVEEDKVASEGLTPDEEKAIKTISNLISKEEAEKTAREILDIGEEFKLANIYLFKSWRNAEEYNWEMNFENNDNGEYTYASVSIDAKSKKLTNLYRDSSTSQGEKLGLNKEESLSIAKDFIEKHNPENYKEVELRENYMGSQFEERKYNFNFIRKIDKAYVENDGISIYVNPNNGKIEQYNLAWDKNEFPSRDNLISLDRAYDILFENVEVELMYTNNNPSEKEAILIYGLKSEKPSNIDAKTGNILNDSGRPYEEPAVIHYKDIENSYAKDKINILAEYGIALVGEEFRPKDKMMQKDFLYLLIKAKYPYYGIELSEEDIYKQLINMGIVKEEEKYPEKMLTKEEAIKYLIRALEYEKVADLAHIYKDIFKDTKDIAPELKGHVAIAYGLKIVQGYNGNLNPQGEIKREDGANMIYNLLFNGK